MSAVHTVLGPIDPGQLGQVLMHEHLVFGYPGFELDPLLDWDRQTTIDEQVDRLAEAKQAGLGAYVDLTAIGVNRDVPLMQEISRRTGVPVIACTGWWLHIGNPQYFHDLSVERLTDIMIHELTHGIGNTNVRAGIIKVATSENQIHPVEEKVLRAAGRAQKATGCCISTHTSRSTMGEEQIDLFAAEGADLAHVIIGHSDDRDDLPYHRRMLARGVTVEFDHIGSGIGLPDSRKAEMLAELISEGHASHLTLSQDTVGDVPGRPEMRERFKNRRPAYLFTTFVPMLKALGVSDDALHAMLVANPARLLPFA